MALLPILLLELSGEISSQGGRLPLLGLQIALCCTVDDILMTKVKITLTQANKGTEVVNLRVLLMYQPPVS